MKLKRPFKKLSQAEDRNQKTGNERNKKLIRKLGQRFFKPKREQRFDERHIDRMNSIQQFLINPQDKRHRPTRNSGHHIRRPHAKPTHGNTEIIFQRTLILGAEGGGRRAECNFVRRFLLHLSLVFSFNHPFILSYSRILTAEAPAL